MLKLNNKKIKFKLEVMNIYYYFHWLYCIHLTGKYFQIKQQEEQDFFYMLFIKD